MVIETKEEIAARIAKKEPAVIRNPIKIINSSYIRMFCHNQDIKVSEEAIKEIANMNRKLLQNIIDDTKEMGYKVVLRRHVERHAIVD